VSFRITRTSLLWDGDRYGFPWREAYAEVLYHGQQVVVVSPECDDPCYRDLRRWAKVEPNLVVVDSEHLGDDIYKHGPAVMRAIEEHATGDFVFHFGSDEFVEVEPLLAWLKENDKFLTERHGAVTPPGVVMERLDFSYSSKLLTDLFAPRSNMYILQGVARKWCPDPAYLTPGAGAFHGIDKHESLECPVPFWHYYGLLSNEQNADETRRLQLSDYKLAGAVRARDDDAWTSKRFKTNPRLSPPRPLTRSHPKIMWPWLSRAEMYWHGK